jgi:hypothetical protein
MSHRILAFVLSISLFNPSWAAVDFDGSNQTVAVKVRIALLPDLPDRIQSQIKTGIKSKISSGEAD